MVAGLEQLAAVAAAVDEGVHRLAVGRDLAESQLAVLVVLVTTARARAGRRAATAAVERGVGVVDEPREVVHAVAVASHVLGDRRLGARARRTRRSGCRPARARSSPCRARRSRARRTRCSWKPNADIRNPAVVRALPTQNSMQSQPRRCAAGLSVIVMLRSNPVTRTAATTRPVLLVETRTRQWETPREPARGSR